MCIFYSHMHIYYLWIHHIAMLLQFIIHIIININCKFSNILKLINYKTVIKFTWKPSLIINHQYISGFCNLMKLTDIENYPPPAHLRQKGIKKTSLELKTSQKRGSYNLYSGSWHISHFTYQLSGVAMCVLKLPLIKNPKLPFLR